MSNQHRKGNAFRDANVPGDPRLLDALTRRTPKAAGMQVTHTHSGTIITRKRTKTAASSALPFKVSLTTTAGSPPTYEVNVGWGYVCERIPGPDDAAIYHEAANMWGEEDPTKLRKFAITAGQAVYLKVNVKADGRIGQPAATPPEIEGGEPTQEDAVTIVVGADEENSSHYHPRVDDLTSDGSPGYYNYKLAVLTAGEGDAPPKLTKWLTGSHIDHFEDLPAILTAMTGGEGIGIVPKEWNESERAYKLRAIKQKEPVELIPPSGDDPGTPAQAVQIRVIQEIDAILIHGNGKTRTVHYKIGIGSEIPVVTFDDGLQTIDDGGVKLVIPIPQVIGRAEEPQVRVTAVEQGYSVEGNGKRRAIKYQIAGTSVPVDVAIFDDGLETTGNEAGNEIIIPIPAAGGNGMDGTLGVIDTYTATETTLISWTNGMVNEEGPITFEVDSGGGGGGGGMPSGSAGDMLYHDGTGWVLLANPGSSSSGTVWVLDHGGDVPFWDNYTEKTILLCEGGSPVSYKILTKPA